MNSPLSWSRSAARGPDVVALQKPEQRIDLYRRVYARKADPDEVEWACSSWRPPRHRRLSRRDPKAPAPLSAWESPGVAAGQRVRVCGLSRRLRRIEDPHRCRIIPSGSKMLF